MFVTVMDKSEEVAVMQVAIHGAAEQNETVSSSFRLHMVHSSLIFILCTIPFRYSYISLS